MPDDPTTPTTRELGSRLEDTRQDLRERYAALGARLDQLANLLANTTVSLPVYQAHLDATRREHDDLGKDIAELAARLEADQRQRSNDRRLILMALFTSILAPLALLVVQTLLRSKGGSP